jgi:molybdopterin-binding protein
MRLFSVGRGSERLAGPSVAPAPPSSGVIVMKISARNQISGRLVALTDGAVNGTVKVDIGNGTIVTASITEEAIAELALKEGDQVTVIVKASDVMIGK